MLTITISARALILAAFLALIAAFGLYATDALAGDPAEPRIQGDVNCDEDVNATDALNSLLHAAALDPAEQTEPCTDIGDVIPSGEGPPGINLFANVGGDGELESGTAVGVQKVGTGVYEVAFGPDVSACSPGVTLGLTVSGSFHTAAVAQAHVGIGETEPEEVRINIRTAVAPHDLVDSDFHLIVVC